MHPLFAGSLQLSLLLGVLQPDLFVMYNAVEVSFLALGNDEAEVLLTSLGFRVFWNGSELDSFFGAWVGASGGFHTNNVIFLHKAGALDLLGCGLRFNKTWSLLDLRSWCLLGMLLVLELYLVVELVSDSRLEERQILKLVSVGVNPFLEELV